MPSTVVAVNCRSAGRAAADVGWPVAVFDVLALLEVFAVPAVLVLTVGVPPALVVLPGNATGPVAVQAVTSRVAAATFRTA